MAKLLQLGYRRVRIVLNCVFIFVGIIVLTGILDITADSLFWAPWLLTLIGVFFLSLSVPNAKIVGVVLTVLGVYLILRYFDIISAPLLRYGVSIALIMFGVINLVRDAEGGSIPPNKTDPTQNQA